MHLRVRVAVCVALVLGATVGAGSPVGAAPSTPAGDGALAPGAQGRSIFLDDRLRGSGWAACPDPISWSLDTGDLPVGMRASVAAADWPASSGAMFSRKLR